MARRGWREAGGERRVVVSRASATWEKRRRNERALRKTTPGSAIAPTNRPGRIACGGSVSAEHGDGILRTPYLRQQYPRLVELFDVLKSALDPDRLLNPGKIVSRARAPDLRNLRWRADELAPEPEWVSIRRLHSSQT